METPATTDQPVIEATRLPDLCVGILDEILLRLQAEPITDNDDLIHQLRVLTKRLRAAWNMVRGIVPVEKVKERRSTLREISARYSGSRDQAVLKDLCDSLAEDKPDDHGEVLRALGGTIQLADTPTHGSAEELSGQLEEEKGEWLALDWIDPSAHRDIVDQNIAKSLEKARKTTRKARKKLCSDHWHDWRKALKQLRYQREFLAEMEGRPLTDFETRVSELGSLLGQRNDLANLEKHIDAEDMVSIDDQAVLDSVLGQSTGRIVKECRKLGKKLFPKEPATK